MFKAVLGFIGLVIGALITEAYKRHRDACATAAALAGELASYRTAHDELDVSLPLLIQRVQAGERLNIPEQDPAEDVAYRAYVDKLGLLGPALAEDTAFVYGKLRGFRSVFRSMTKASSEADAVYMEACLRVAHEFTRQAKRKSDVLIPQLQEISKRPFMYFLVAWLGKWKRGRASA